MTTFQIGRRAEAQAAEYLKGQGYQLLDQNWRTRYCEIDLVVSKDGAVYFTEVKYRYSNDAGRGLEYITAKKLKQMALAAEFWVSNHHWKGDYRLSVIEVSGPNYEITNFLNEL